MRLSLLVLALLVGTSHAAPDPKIQLAVNAIPELAKVSRGRVRVTVRGIVPKAQQKELVQLVDRVVADVGRRFLDSKGDPHAEITLCLFAEDARYRQLAAAFGTPIPSDWGFYRTDQRTATALRRTWRVIPTPSRRTCWSCCRTSSPTMARAMPRSANSRSIWCSFSMTV